MPNLLPFVIDKVLVDRDDFHAHKSLPKVADRQGIGLEDCWQIIKRRREIISLLFVLTLVSATVVLLCMTPNYGAKALLLIEPEAPRLLDVKDLLSDNAISEEHDYYKTQHDLLQSERLAAQVIHDLKLEQNRVFNGSAGFRGFLGNLKSSLSLWPAQTRPPTVSSLRLGVSPATIDTYLSRLHAETKAGTRLVEVSFVSPDPMLSAQIVNAHVQAYIQEDLDLRQQAGKSAKEFLEKQLVQIRDRMEKSEAVLNTYRNRMGILSFGVKDQEKNKIAEARMAQLTQALTQAETQRIAYEGEVQLVRTGDYDSLPEVVSNPMIQTLKPEVDRLRAEYSSMRSKYTDNYPKLEEASAQLREAQRRVGTEVGAIARAVERRYQAAETREEKLRQRVTEEKQRDLALNDVSLRDAVLTREVEANRDLYRDVLKRMEEIGMNGSAPVSNISVVQEAVPPVYPSSPKKLKTLTISGLLALIMGVGLAFVLDQFDTRFKSAEESESYLQLPNLAVVPDFRRMVTKQNRTPVLGLLAESDYVNETLQRPVAALRARYAADVCREVYRSIRTAILFPGSLGTPQTILFTSALSEEGKTTTAMHTALAFAQTGARTLLIDADLRGPSCHRLLGMQNSVGLSDVLLGHVLPVEAICAAENDSGLFLLGAGSAVPNMAELLTSVRMHDVLRFLSEQYQFILLDSSPVVFASDTVGLAIMVDGVVVIAGATTAKQTVRSACQRLVAAGAKIVGVVLNGADIRDSDYREFERYYSRYNGRYHSERKSTRPASDIQETQVVESGHSVPQPTIERVG
jgi:polysaccharide biosynthesis transport protein